MHPSVHWLSGKLNIASYRAEQSVVELYAFSANSSLQPFSTTPIFVVERPNSPNTGNYKNFQRESCIFFHALSVYQVSLQSA